MALYTGEAKALRITQVVGCLCYWLLALKAVLESLKERGTLISFL